MPYRENSQPAAVVKECVTGITEEEHKAAILDAPAKIRALYDNGTPLFTKDDLRSVGDQLLRFNQPDDRI